MIHYSKRLWRLFLLLLLSVVSGSIPLALSREIVPAPGEDLVYANDPRLQFNPPLNSTVAVWTQQNVKGSNATAVETSDPQASVSLVFQGTSIRLYTFASRDFPTLLAQIDTRQFMISDPPGNGTDAEHQLFSVTLNESELDGSTNHTVTVQKNPNADDDAKWNVIAFSFATPPVGPPLLDSPPLASEVSVAGSMSTKDSSNRVSHGAVAGIVVATFIGLALVGGFLLCLRHRRHQNADVSPDPIVISPVTSRPDRSRFRRLNSIRLPHFTAPTSIWPTSLERTSMTVDPRVQEMRTSSRDRVAPFTLPVIPPRIVAPSPPKRLKPQRPKSSRFFVANPSSRSSRSTRSLSLNDIRVRPERMPVKDNKVDLLGPANPSPLGNGDEAVIKQEQGLTRVDKGKQRAVDFEIDPVQPRRPDVARKRTLRRIFFTTNPSPSVSSGSSSASHRSASMRKAAAVAGYVRDQMRRRPPRGRPSNQAQPQMSAPARAPVSIPSIPENMPTDMAVSPPEVFPSRQAPGTSRNSRTRFFATNPSPSLADHTSERAETESVLSEIPPPRKDKGKARAF